MVREPETPAPTDQPVMKLANVSKFFSGVPALENISLEILAGEVHALLGENGAGKSTLMNIATGTLQPTGGDIFIDGQIVDSLNPGLAADLGIAIVHQHPALMPDLTVLENFLVALPRDVFHGDTPMPDVAKGLLSAVGLENINLYDRVETLSVATKHLIEIAKALAVKPKILVLDEPTAPLGQDSVALLFALVRNAVAAGTSVVYITHRLAEVREVASRVTVLRDGKLRATSSVAEISDAELLAQIIGRELDSTFPGKFSVPPGVHSNLFIDRLSGPGFHDVSIEGFAGQIIGLAGVSGNGQRELLRAVAGLENFSGTVTIDGRSRSGRELLSYSALMPADRQSEGLMMRMTVRENASVTALKKFKNRLLLNRKKEAGMVLDVFDSLAVKAPSSEALVSSLSGGNQQKILMSRTLLSDPILVLADEPTQGVDVGARAELYQILRNVSQSGVPVLIASSDAKELEGLCDVVAVMSRGQVVQTLQGDEINEKNMIHAAVTSTLQTLDSDDFASLDAKNLRKKMFARAARFTRGDYAPSALLGLVMFGLGAFIFSGNDRYLSSFNISSMLLLATALGFIALGQTIALITGGIDLAVGPLAGLVVVVSSFFFLEGSPALSLLLGLLAMLAVSLAVGLFNGLLIRYIHFTAIAATLVTYIALQGVSFLLRPSPDGFIDVDVARVIAHKWGALPSAFLVLVVVTITMEWALRKTRWGWNLRAVGSEEEAARRVGVKTNLTFVTAYMAVGFFTFLGAIMLMAQLGIGDATQGIGYTLSSITAVVLGGTSLVGGRGTFLGTVLGSMLLIQVLNATVFLGLTQTWQFILQGGLILVAAILYSSARSQKRKL